MTCPDTGAWRAWLDQPRADLELHLAACAECQGEVERLRANCELAAASVPLLVGGLPASSIDIAAARQRLLAVSAEKSRPAGERPQERLQPAKSRAAFDRPQERLQAEKSRAAIERQDERLQPVAERSAFGDQGGRCARPWTPPLKWRIAASGMAAAVVLTLVLSVSPEGRALASQFLAQFRSQQVAAIEITPQSQADIQRTMSTLGKLGLVRAPAYARSGRVGDSASSVGSVAEASQRVGFALKSPDPASLPADLTAASPRIQVVPADEVRFTFDKAKAQAYFQSTGHPEVSLPDRFDGATLVVSMPAAALVQYGGSGGKDALIIGQAGELAVGVEGSKNVSLAELRDFLLGLPEIPADTAAQLRSIGDWRTTLPIPIPTDRVHWQSASFAGHSGLLLNDNSGVGSAAIWQADGHLYGLAGSLKAADLQRVAAGLR